MKYTTRHSTHPAYGRNRQRYTRPLTKHTLRSRIRAVLDFGVDHPVFVLLLLALVVGLVWIYASSHHMQTTSGPTQTDTSSSNSAPTLEKGTPSYDTVLPVGKSINQLGGWTRVSPPDHNPVYAFVDKIGLVGITVSEQPIPSEFGSDIKGGVKTLAADYNANETLTVGDLTVYIGTSLKGPQSVIFIDKDILVLIKSSTSIPTQQWSTYIASLQ